MDETDVVCVKAYSSIRIGSWGSIFEISLDRAAQMAQLAAYLVVTPSKQLDLQKVVAVSAAYESIVEFCELCALASLGNNIGLVLFFISGKPVFQMSFVCCRPLAAESAIGLVDIRAAEHCAQPFHSLGGLCKDAYSAYRAVESVRYTHIYLSRFIVALGNIGLESLREAFISGLVPLHDFTDLLVDDEKVVVFKKNPGLKVPDLSICKCSVFQNQLT